MAHTPEQRDKHALCGAKKKNGEKCRKFAGEGTNHFGYGRCKYHLGNAPLHIKHAAKLEAQQHAVDWALQFGEELEVEPHEALLTVLNLSYGHLMFVRSELGVAKDEASFERDVLLTAWNTERDRVAHIAKLCLDAGVDERRVRLAERYGEVLAQLLHNIFGDAELALTRKQQAVLEPVLRRHLVAIDGRAELPAGG
jgi:hypothetical protein